MIWVYANLFGIQQSKADRDSYGPSSSFCWRVTGGWWLLWEHKPPEMSSISPLGCVQFGGNWWRFIWGLNLEEEKWHRFGIFYMPVVGSSFLRRVAISLNIRTMPTPTILDTRRGARSLNCCLHLIMVSIMHSMVMLKTTRYLDTLINMGSFGKFFDLFYWLSFFCFSGKKNLILNLGWTSGRIRVVSLLTRVRIF